MPIGSLCLVTGPSYRTAWRRKTTGGRPSGVGGLEGGEVAGGAAELDADEVDRLPFVETGCLSAGIGCPRLRLTVSPSEQP